MFDITGGDIADLSDADLRTLVARLALAELRKQGAALSSVIAGGNQDAADGGLDVRVECSAVLINPDFVPRPHTGFQVKKSDMPAGKITSEMRPKPTSKRGAKTKGELRQTIRDLAELSGSYIIISSGASVTGMRLNSRRKAIREALHDLPHAEKLHTDFYDQDRLATWANEYPGTAAWIQARIGRSISGWSSVGDWLGTEVNGPTRYFFDDKACLTDESARDRRQLTITEGIRRLRGLLRTPKQCVRLIGLSGRGKTRLVQALFETGIGEDPLDPNLAVYTDYSVDPTPTAHDMALWLKQSGQRAILIVDNCNPATHTKLAEICSQGSGAVSLLTIEYDVRDDEPERTDVFRLQSASKEFVADWLKQSFPEISEIDCRSIVDLSESNFRVSYALAETLGKGETLGSLKKQDLFHRLFFQRNQLDKELLLAAEDLSLLYSVNIEDVSSTGELALIGGLRKIEPTYLYAVLNELSERGIAQARGRWKAILPQAISNRLAAAALKRIPPSVFDGFAASLTPRVQRSLSRRLGFLHDSQEAKAIVSRWLKTDGPLGDLISRGEKGIEILENLAPVLPDAVLEKIQHEFDGPRGHNMLAPGSNSGWRLIHLIKELGYEARMFEAAAVLLARFLASEPQDHRQNSAREPFAAWFRLELSGTEATPEQRRSVIRYLAASEDPDLYRCVPIAMEALLNTSGFIAIGRSGFGSRSRGWGWQPALMQEICHWYSGAIDLAVELAPKFEEIRDVLAQHVRGLVISNDCCDALDRAVSKFMDVKPWLNGWLAFRTALSFDGKVMPDDLRRRLEAIIERLKPTNLLNQARAVMLWHGNWSWDDGEADESGTVTPWERASRLAQDIGKLLANDETARRAFIPELIASSQAVRAFECGRGLAQGAEGLAEMWREMVEYLEAADIRQLDATVFGGFIHEAQQRDPAFVQSAMDMAVENPAIAQVLPFLQARVGIDEDGIARLRRTIQHGAIEAWAFRNVSGGIIGGAPPEALAKLLCDIANMPDGVKVALNVLHMYVYFERQAGKIINAALIEVGCMLLEQADFGCRQTQSDHEIGTMIEVCCVGPEGQELTHKICLQICDEVRTKYLSYHNIRYVLDALFKTQPLVTLDLLLTEELAPYNRWLFRSGYGYVGPLDRLDPFILSEWANGQPDTRYSLFGGDVLSMFVRDNNENDTGFSPIFLELLAHAPDKKAFLGGIRDRLQPRGWGGSLADILTRRKAKLQLLREHTHADVRQWVQDIEPALDRWIADERSMDRGGEEAFE